MEEARIFVVFGALCGAKRGPTGALFHRRARRERGGSFEFLVSGVEF